MIQSDGMLGKLIAAIPQVMILARKEELQKGISLAPKVAAILAEKATEYSIKEEKNKLSKKFT